MAIVKRLVLKNYRSFPSATLDFSDPLFLVGCNGSGKSNLASAFALLADAMVSPLQEVFNRRGGFESICHLTSNDQTQAQFGMGIEFGQMDGAEGGRFAFLAIALPNHRFQIVREQAMCQIDGDRWYYNRKVDVRTPDGHGTLRTDDGKFRISPSAPYLDEQDSNTPGLKPMVEASALRLPLVAGDARFAPLFRALRSMRVYSIAPSTLREPQDPADGLVLKADGSNAASVLQELSGLPEAATTLAEINQMLEAIVPATTSVAPKAQGNKLSLAFTQQWGDGKSITFNASDMSDGTLRSLGLILAVYQKPCPSLLVLEEPEATIHPGALGAVLDLISCAAERMQVVVTTHSPELLDAKWIKDDNLRLVCWKNGASRLFPPSEASRLAMRQHLMGAGELLRSNALHPGEETLAEGSLFEALP